MEALWKHRLVVWNEIADVITPLTALVCFRVVPLKVIYRRRVQVHGILQEELRPHSGGGSWLYSTAVAAAARSYCRSYSFIRSIGYFHRGLQNLFTCPDTGLEYCHSELEEAAGTGKRQTQTTVWMARGTNPAWHF